MNSIWLIVFCVDFIIYGLCCIMIIVRKNYTSISIRSPTLILTNIVGNFFMSIIIILFKLFENNYCSSFYYFFRLMMILSILFAYERILNCFRIEKINIEEEELDQKLLSEKKFLFQEKFYVRLLLCVLLIFLIAMITIKVINIEEGALFYTIIFLYKYKENSDSDYGIYKSQIIFLIIWSFVEQFIMITYIYRILSKSIKEYIKTELIFFFIVWYIYGLFCTFISFYEQINLNDNETYKVLLIIISLIIQYICLFLSGYMPILLSYLNKTEINYCFNQKLMSNLYLFLTNEECYDAFSNYLYKTSDNRGLFYLKLYTHIMKYKLSFSLDINRNEVYNDAIRIYDTFFNNNNNNKLYVNLIEPYVLNKVRNDCRKMENNTFTADLFDEALLLAFNKLKYIFNVYRKSLEYREIYNKIKLYSYLNCKMCITGLIDKY